MNNLCYIGERLITCYYLCAHAIFRVGRAYREVSGSCASFGLAEDLESTVYISLTTTVREARSPILSLFHFAPGHSLLSRV